MQILCRETFAESHAKLCMELNEHNRINLEVALQSMDTLFLQLVCWFSFSSVQVKFSLLQS